MINATCFGKLIANRQVQGKLFKLPGSYTEMILLNNQLQEALQFQSYYYGKK